ncbi:hypothetical protein llap_13317 [Limosa lapponica baueri]|uniref:Uncharacterized protein n=1 Tax=Limosa lapponica baueri TaxID=1758121 RepID=A0A2I0TRF9_LIMLA|nr:hypothetical protein llap_13317 [Limosa lapponica baueri]
MTAAYLIQPPPFIQSHGKPCPLIDSSEIKPANEKQKQDSANKNGVNTKIQLYAGSPQECKFWPIQEPAWRNTISNCPGEKRGPGKNRGPEDLVDLQGSAPPSSRTVHPDEQEMKQRWCQLSIPTINGRTALGSNARIKVYH